MKIYFEDGELTKILQLPKMLFHIVDAKHGVNSNIVDLNKIIRDPYLEILYTNSILAFSNEYAWNEELQTPEIYIRNKEKEWTLIQEFTNRDLKQGHNLAKMYIAGEFEQGN